MNFDWVTISQTSGKAGEQSLAVTVTQDNRSPIDRVKVFVAVSPDGKERAILTITQKARPKEFNNEFNTQQFH